MKAYQRLILFLFISLNINFSFAENRLPTINSDHYSQEQQEAQKIFENARKTKIFGPFEPLLYSPQLMNEARSMGDYLRYHSAIGNTLSELTILVTSRFWTQDYEWYVHAPIALKKGISASTIEAIRQGQIPTNMNTEEQLVYQFTVELLNNKQVSNTTYSAIEKHFGKKGAVDLAGIVGYYSFLALEMNMAQYPLPKDGVSLPRFPENR
ncbi:carboxymuconolactone decarboxylase family protein [Ferrovum sp. PN-J185]|uniref:carboxymuconolactone decarboxylase family protein n=1 Tax=Ferrovum sp. PN-J185 TaxID=1356306 RepID=UPI001E2BDA88|nr:carboxymuconolactone decarboxylase family protein [Ferrovum sp. PN-J185]MCC6067997.1 carboxymuconolactone decarboxylase family protein [Ferrovum sp. PN-J185]